MALFWCVLYLLALIVIGAAIAFAIIGQEHRRLSEILALTLSLGPGVSAASLLWLSLCGLAPGRILIMLIAIGAIALIIAVWLRQRLTIPLLPVSAQRWWLDLLAIPLLLVLLASLAHALIASVGFPLINWDSVVIWGFKAKALYYGALTPRPWYFTDVRYSYSHLDYPLLAPMLMAGAWAMMHQVHEPLGKLVFPLIYCGLLLLIYTGTRHFVPRLPALMLTVLAGCPAFVVAQSSMANADLVLMTFRAGAVVYMVKWIDQRERSDAIFTALYCILAAMTKNEGLPLALLTLAIMCSASFRLPARARRWRHIALAAVMLVLGIGVWEIWQAFLPHTDENYIGKMRWSNMIANISRIGTIIHVTLIKMGDIAFWGGLWMLVPLIAACGYRAFAKLATQALWAMLLTHLALYAFVYIITPWNVIELIVVSEDRLFMHIAPTAAMLIAAHWASAMPQFFDVPRLESRGFPVIPVASAT